MSLLLAVVTTLVAVASTGSNQATYGTNFAPAELTGQVTSDGSPVVGASIHTIAGHLTTTDGSGNYTLFLDAPGIYTVTAESGIESVGDTVEVTMGAAFNLNLALGTLPAPTPTPTPIPGVTQWGLVAIAVLFGIVLLRRFSRNMGSRPG